MVATNQVGEEVKRRGSDLVSTILRLRYLWDNPDLNTLQADGFTTEALGSGGH